MKSTIAVTVALLGSIAPQAHAAASNPNIVFIAGDDCGFNEFSFNSSKIPTPRTDSITKDGVTLTNAYVSSAVSASNTISLPPARVGANHEGAPQGINRPSRQS